MVNNAMLRTSGFDPQYWTKSPNRYTHLGYTFSAIIRPRLIYIPCFVETSTSNNQFPKRYKKIAHSPIGLGQRPNEPNQ